MLRQDHGSLQASQKRWTDNHLFQVGISGRVSWRHRYILPDCDTIPSPHYLLDSALKSGCFCSKSSAKLCVCSKPFCVIGGSHGKVAASSEVHQWSKALEASCASESGQIGCHYTEAMKKLNSLQNEFGSTKAKVANGSWNRADWKLKELLNSWEYLCWSVTCRVSCT